MALKSKLSSGSHRGKPKGPEHTWVTVRLDRADAAKLDELREELTLRRDGSVTRTEAVRQAIRLAQRGAVL